MPSSSDAEEPDILKQVREAAEKRILFLPHAVNQMNAPDRMISTQEVRMECLYCKGALVRQRISYTATRRGYHLIVHDVPAWVCEQCGEPFLDETTVDAIQDVLQSVDTGLAESTLSLAAA